MASSALLCDLWKEALTGIVVVDYFGLPCSGKTFRACELVQVAQRKQLSVDSRGVRAEDLSKSVRTFRKARLATAAMLRRPVLSVAFLHWCWRQPTQSRLHRCKAALNALAIIGIYAAPQGRVVILEQGIPQILWALASDFRHSATWYRPDKAKEFLVALGANKVVAAVLCDAPDEIIRDRLARRAPSRAPSTAVGRRAVEMVVRILNGLDAQTRWRICTIE